MSVTTSSRLLLEDVMIVVVVSACRLGEDK